MYSSYKNNKNYKLKNLENSNLNTLKGKSEIEPISLAGIFDLRRIIKILIISGHDKGLKSWSWQTVQFFKNIFISLLSFSQDQVVSVSKGLKTC
jgi:hypothetical protein